MKYKTMGETELEVSTLALGTMTFGDGADESACRDIYNAARDAGVTVFDCANVYASGRSEIILGSLAKDHRSDVILTSKAYYPMSDDPEVTGLGKIALLKSIEASLNRLQTNYLDIFFLHSFDPLVPLEETFEALDQIIRQGKARYIGLSNFAAWQVMKAQRVAADVSDFQVGVIQPMYNLFKRQAETELFPMALSEGLGVFTYSPMAGGLLTGKYQPSQGDKGRFDQSAMYRDRYASDSSGSKVADFIDVANKFAVDPVHLAIAWSGCHAAVSAPLIGARTLTQLQRALGSVDLHVTEDMRTDLDQIFPPSPIATDRMEELE